MTPPTCTIIGGPNGAGKTTYALRYLPQSGGTDRFVNADAIAAGLSPLAPERAQVAAGRLFLQEIRAHVAARRSFAFESTLAGLSSLKLLRDLLAAGWDVELYYLWLPSVLLAKARVAERVANGGHAIPDEVVERRYGRSVANLLETYAPLCTSTTCLDNSVPEAPVKLTESCIGRRARVQRLSVHAPDGSSSMMNGLPDRAEEAQRILHQAVAEALERKWRLGQYAVTWRDGRVIKLVPKPGPTVAWTEVPLNDDGTEAATGNAP